MNIFNDETDFTHCYELLKKASERHGCFVHAYVLMHNHFHLLLTPATEEGPAKMMQSVGVSFVKYFNDKNERVGALWQGRYNSTVVQSGNYLLACSRYIELNPVRAGFAAHPAAHKWSSFCRNAMGQRDELITSHQLYQELADDDHERRMRYQQMFRVHIDEDECNKIRAATNSGDVLGAEDFERFVGARLNRDLKRAPHGGLREQKVADTNNVVVRYPANIRRPA